jgi:hypothetical protein
MNSQNMLTIVLLAVVVLLGLIWVAKPNQDNQAARNPNAATKSQLTLSEDIYDLGTVFMSQGNISKKITLSNNTQEDIIVKKIFTSCMCTEAFIVSAKGRKGPFGMPGHGQIVRDANETIKSGESREVEIIFDPNAHGPAGIGRVLRVVYFEDSLGNVAQFEFEGTVRP